MDKEKNNYNFALLFLLLVLTVSTANSIIP